jgi:hypothetical protein
MTEARKSIFPLHAERTNSQSHEQEFALIAEDYPDWSVHRELCVKAQAFVEERDLLVFPSLLLSA